MIRYALLLLIVLVVFGRGLCAEFVDWDDNTLIYSNPDITQPTLHGLSRMWNPADPEQTWMYNPMVCTVWWVLAHSPRLPHPDLLGNTLNPFWFHAANLLIHWLSACIVLEILRRLGLRVWPAFGGAVLFAIHPLQTEPVLWATGLKDLLSGFLSLAAISFFIIAADSPEKSVGRGIICCPLFSLWPRFLSKPSTVILPLIVLAIDRIVLKRSWKTALVWTAPWLPLAAAITLLANHVQHFELQIPLWTRPLVAGDALGFYLVKLFAPIHLAFDYGRTPEAIFNDPAFHAAGYWMWIVPFLAFAAIWRIGNRLVWLASLIFLIAFVPVLGFVPFKFQIHSTVADRYAYLSMLGAAMAGALILQNIPNRASMIAATFAFCVLGPLSFVQAGRWNNTQALFEYGLSLHRTNPAHYLILGQYQDKESETARNRGDDSNSQMFREEAIASYRNALEGDPNLLQAIRNLTVDLILSGQVDPAIEVTRERIQLQESLPKEDREDPAMLHGTLGMLYYRAQKWDLAAEEFRQSLALRPNDTIRRQLFHTLENTPATRP